MNKWDVNKIKIEGIESSPRINKQKQAIIDELYGSLQGTNITLDELKKVRLGKYEQMGYK